MGITIDDDDPVVSDNGERPVSVRRRRGRSDRGGRLLSAHAAATHMGLPYETLRRAALTGRIPYLRIPGQNRMWFDKRDLDKALEAWKIRGGGEF